MSKPAYVDEHVLKATTDALVDLAGAMAGMLPAADGLGRGAVATADLPRSLGSGCPRTARHTAVSTCLE